jgi:DNA-binding beta-propeller fold protein YncE
MRLIHSLFMLVLAGGASAQVPGLAGTIIVTNKTPFTATIIDVASGRTLATLPTGPGPHEITLSRDGRLAVVTDYGAAPRKTLTVIDVPAMKVARTIDLGTYTAPHGIHFLPGDSVVAVTSEATGNLVLVNVVEGAVRRAIATSGRGSHMVGVTANGGRGYTGNMQSNSVSELDLATGQLLRQIDVPERPEAINVTPDGAEVWVGSNTTGKVSAIDVKTWSVATVGEGFRWPYRMFFSPDVKTAVIPDLTNEDLRFFDRASKKELGKVLLPGAGPEGITSTPDGKYVLLSLSKQAKVAIIDVASRTVIGYLAAGETPDGIVYTTRVFTR